MQKSEIQNLIEPYLLPQMQSYVVVFYDGEFVADLMPEKTLPSGMVTIGVSDKICMEINPNITLSRPLHMLFLTTREPKDGLPINYDNKIVVGTNSKITIIEEHIVLSNVTKCHNVSTHIQTESHSKVLYYKIFNAAQAQHEANLQLSPGGESEITTNHLIFGGAEVKEKILANLVEPQAVCHNIGLYELKGKQQLDLNILLEHIACDCESKVLFKGIVADEARAKFSGHITVREGALRSCARLDNKNILLHDTARVTTSPALEIYADDVQCSHGATVGQLDEQALWYLQSRGINKDQAKQILIQAFLQEIIFTLPEFLQDKVNNGSFRF